jgi:cardiolipin synthase A/B
MSRHLLGACCAFLLFAVCGCAYAPTTVTSAGGTRVPSVGVTGGLSLITEPGPGDEPFVELIDSARHTVEVTMYELTDERVEQALVADVARGVRVAVLLDRGQYGAGQPLNDAAYRYLGAHGVRVAWAPGYFALTHQKSIVIDAHVAAIMTLNLTPEYYESSRDFAALDYRPADVEAIERTFDADLDRRQVIPSAGSGDLIWSPGAQAQISALILHARRSLQIESEEMDEPTVTRELCLAARRGVQVRVVMTYQSDSRAALSYLAGCGARVRTYSASAALYIHAKLIRADARIVFLGSQNLSRQSLDYNRELGIITENPQIAASTGETFDSDFAAAAQP